MDLRWAKDGSLIIGIKVLVDYYGQKAQRLHEVELSPKNIEQLRAELASHFAPPSPPMQERVAGHHDKGPGV